MNDFQRNLPKQSRSIPRFYWLLRILILLALLLSLAWGWHLIRNPRFMPIKNIKLVATYQHIDQQTLQKIIAPYTENMGLFSVDTETLKQALLQQPWVYSVLIKRVWPDQIEVNIIEQKAVAYWNKDGLLNSQGQEFTPNKKTFPTGLVELRGPEGQQQQVLLQFQQFNSLLSPLNLSITELDLNSRGSWQMTLGNGMEIILGRVDIGKKFNRFVDVYPKVLASQAQNVMRVDLRYSDGLAVQWREKNSSDNSSNKIAAPLPQNNT